VIVCVCRRVSDRDIRRAVQEGASSFDELQRELGVATVCGRCRECAQDTLDRACGTACASIPALATGAQRSASGA
jgi:bacterioferritin-associated ferredoxin